MNPGRELAQRIAQRYEDHLRERVEMLATWVGEAGFEPTPVQTGVDGGYMDGYVAAWSTVPGVLPEGWGTITTPMIQFGISTMLGDDYVDQLEYGLEFAVHAFQDGRPVLVYETVGRHESYSFAPAIDPGAVYIRWQKFNALLRDRTRVVDKIIDRARRDREPAGNRS